MPSFKLFSVLAAVAFANTEIAQSCLQSRTHLYGIHGEEDLPFSDFNYLSNTEEFNTIYRLTRF